MRFKTGVGILLICKSAAALADVGPPGVQLGLPVAGGSGCPAGTVSSVLAPDLKSLSVLFDQYQVQVGRSAGKNMDRKNCNVAIPVHVPQGYSVSILSLDYRGFNNLPQGAQSRFNVEYFFAGTQGPGMSRGFSGPVSDNFLIHNDLVASASSWSACGEDVNLRVNSDLMVQTDPYGQDALSSIDSADVKASLVYQLSWRRCDGGVSNPPYEPVPQPLPQPTYEPAPQPTYYPQPQPTYYPQPQPTYYPQPQPTYYPQPQPTYYPQPQPTYYPQPQPTYYPQPQPTYYPQPQPTYYPQPQPTYYPQPQPTYYPQPQPTYRPYPQPPYYPGPRPPFGPRPFPGPRPPFGPGRGGPFGR